MIRLTRYSEPFAASGGMGARTTRRALGARTLSFWELFLRETLQNSWDARRSAAGAISFSVDAWTATMAQRTYLSDYVLTNPPPLLGLESALEDVSLSFLAVSDSGTWGLSGPTRADVDPAGDRSDFVDFVRDTGRRANKGFAGGTYGFGKVVLCEASAVSTIVIYTKTMMSGLDSSRFIAMAVGDDEYTERGVRYTGRHWWGSLRTPLLAEPLRGPEADTAAFNLGMHNLIKGVSGTAILVVAPRSPQASAEENLQKITEDIAHAAGEYAWPHILPGRAASIDLTVTLNRNPVRVPSPATDARLRVFADAFMHCQQLADGTLEPGDVWPWHHRVLRSTRPDAALGTLVWHQSLPAAHPAASGQPQSQVALIRKPHFVVAYRDVPAHPSGGNTYGVFLAAPELDQKYAASETPTHDEWKPKPGVHFDPARRALKQINDAIKERPRGDRSLATGAEAPGVVTIASALGILLDGQTSIGDSRIPWAPEAGTKKDEGETGMVRSPRADPSRPSPGNAPASISGASNPPLTTDTSLSRTSNGEETPPASDGSYAPRSEGPLFPNQGGTGDPRSRRRPLRAPTVRPNGDPQLCVYEGAVAAEFPFSLSIARGVREVTISGIPTVFIDGGRETEPPLGAEMPRVLAWRDLSTGDITQGPELMIIEPTSNKWSVMVSQLPDGAVGVDISVVSYG